MIIRVSPYKEECRQRLLRLESSEVQSLAISAETGFGPVTGQAFDRLARDKFAAEFKRITGVPLELRQQLRAEYEKVLGKTADEILEEQRRK